MAGELVLGAPIAGWAAPLAEVPDPVFAEAMLGDGAAIDPTEGVLHAPCNGVVGVIPAAQHAITLACAGGLEILLHVGLETVALGGGGFRALVAQGQRVAAGDALLAIDLDFVSARAKSLITPMVITELGGYAIARRFTDRLLAVGDPFIELAPAERSLAAAAQETGGAELRREVTVGLEHGLHARPAARVAAALRDRRAEVTVVVGERQANARSPVALMTLGVQAGEVAQLAASGPDAEAVLEMIAGLLIAPDPEPAAPQVARPAPVPPSPTPAGEIRGVCAAPGLAIGPAARLARVHLPVTEQGHGVAAERRALEQALAALKAEVAAAAGAEPDSTRGAVLAAHAVLLDDPELRAEAERRIGEHKSAAFAWRAATGRYSKLLAALADPRLAERVDDLRDLERRGIERLTGQTAPAPEVPAGAILVAEELLPSQLLAVPAGRLAGLAVAGGGPTSHVAILAAAMGLPALVAAGPELAAIEDGATLILDAEAGWLHVSPRAAALKAARRRFAAREDARARARAQALTPAHLTDGTPIAVLANLGSVEDASAAVAAGAEGSGLLRTEFLFLDRAAAPDEAEQAAGYQAIADALGERPLVVRLLDIGADKPAPWLPWPAEQNPALGVRGVRLALRRPDLLQTQLRAILKVRSPGPLSIMAPMVSALAELSAVRAALQAAADDAGCEALPDLGVMVETPAAAMVADQLAAEADFLSIGTNDLAQYVLAMDRGNPALAGDIDALQPAVLRLMATACEGARRHGRPIGVCGGLAGDPAAIPILIGLGVERLSMPAPEIAEAKALIRRLSGETCRALATEALALGSAAEVRALVLARTRTEG